MASVRVRAGRIPLLLLVAVFGLGCVAPLGACHADDAACQPDAPDHSNSICKCSCHVVAMLPDVPVTRCIASSVFVDPAAGDALTIVAPSQPTPPPRG
jgi:hypothetical protein